MADARSSGRWRPVVDAVRARDVDVAERRSGVHPRTSGGRRHVAPAPDQRPDLQSRAGPGHRVRDGQQGAVPGPRATRRATATGARSGSVVASRSRRDVVDIRVAAKRHVARRRAIQRAGRQVHLRSDSRSRIGLAAAIRLRRRGRRRHRGLTDRALSPQGPLRTAPSAAGVQCGHSARAHSQGPEAHRCRRLQSHHSGWDRTISHRARRAGRECDVGAERQLFRRSAWRGADGVQGGAGHQRAGCPASRR